MQIEGEDLTTPAFNECIHAIRGLPPVYHQWRGHLRLPNGKSVTNINHYKLEIIQLHNKDVVQPETRPPDSLQTSVKTVFHVHSNDPYHIIHDMDTFDILYQSPSLFQMPTLYRKTDLLHLYHAHASMLTSTDSLTDTVFSPDEQLQG